MTREQLKASLGVLSTDAENLTNLAVLMSGGSAFRAAALLLIAYQSVRQVLEVQGDKAGAELLDALDQCARDKMPGIMAELKRSADGRMS